MENNLYPQCYISLFWLLCWSVTFSWTIIRDTTQPAPESHCSMNFLNKMNSTLAVTCLVLLAGCYASPVRSPRTSAVKLRNILASIQRVARSDQPSLRQDYPPPDEENGVAVNQSLLSTIKDLVPETIDDTRSFRNPDVFDETEQTTLFLDVDVIHNGLFHSDSIETATQSDIQEIIESDPAQKLEEPSYSKTVAEQEPLSDNLAPHLPSIETSEFHHSSTVAASSDPEELPLMYPPVRVPTAPLVTPISVSDLPLEPFLPSISTTSLPEKVEITSSPEAQDHSSAPELGDNVGALPLNLDPKPVFNFDSQIQVDQPKYQPNISYDLITHDNTNEKDNSSVSRPFGSTPKLRELGFPPISNTQDNFGVQVNWAEFR